MYLFLSLSLSLLIALAIDTFCSSVFYFLFYMTWEEEDGWMVDGGRKGGRKGGWWM